MESRIRPVIEASHGPIILITETSSPFLQDVMDLAPDGDFAVCDFSFQDIERAERTPWGYRFGRLVNIDHHADHKAWERHVSSGNLAIDYVRTNDPVGAVIVNHTDCDSVLSAAIACGLLPPKPEYGAAVIAADHTGEENQIADLLQALQDERDLEYSLRCLADLEAGKPLDERAAQLLKNRRDQRKTVVRAVMQDCSIIGRLACLNLESKIESELLAPLVPDAWAVAMAFPSDDHPRKTELKMRLTAHAPQGFTLRRVELREVDPAYGGRWNAGSNRRGGGSPHSPLELLSLIAKEFKKSEEAWMVERAIQIATEAHAGQIDKAGKPYVLHPLRVMSKMTCDIGRAVAVLHDVVEDCEGWTFERLEEEGFSREVLQPLSLVTKEPGTDLGEWDKYMAFIDRCSLHPVAARVKLADLEDNMDLSRLPRPGERDKLRVRKYAAARQRLLSNTAKGVQAGRPDRDRLEQALGNLVYNFTHKIELDVKQTDHGLVELWSGLPVELLKDARYMLRGAGTSFPSLPAAYTQGGAVVSELLPKGTLLYVSVQAKGVPEIRQGMTYDIGARPVLRGYVTPEDPLTVKVRAAVKDEVFVQMRLEENLRISVPAGRNGELMDCKVSVPSLDHQFDSLNHAYSWIARAFEPWRRSNSGNVFRKIFVFEGFIGRGGEIEERLVWLELLRLRKEIDTRGRLLRKV